jgi:hypothetical protein
VISEIKIGRACNREVKDLRPGLDFRLPEYRREVFHRFYDFHLRNRAHPGCVYFLFDHIFKRLGLNDEQKLWFCFINGNTQNPATTLIIYEKFPDLSGVNVEFSTEFDAWFLWNFKKLAFDLDRRHHKKVFSKAIESYKISTKGDQRCYFDSLQRGCEFDTFDAAYESVTRDFYGFGRLTTWSYLEYLRIAGIKLAPRDLKLRDIGGSRSHRNGLAKVLGRDDIDFHVSNPAFDGSYPEPVMAWLEEEAALLLREAQERAAGRHYAADVNNFTLESALCTFKSFFRPNRRYPGVYVDMLGDRIKEAKRLFPKHSILSLIEEARGALPDFLLYERKPWDVGLRPEKQNHFLKTGQIVTMGFEDPVFTNDYDNATLFK